MPHIIFFLYIYIIVKRLIESFVIRANVMAGQKCVSGSPDETKA